MGHTKGPWKWTSFTGEVQLEGANEASEMNPILVVRGCGNEHVTSVGVKGCMPEKLNDPLRACPLHPTQADRDLIARAPELLRELTEAREALREIVAWWDVEKKRTHADYYTGTWAIHPDEPKWVARARNLLDANARGVSP